MSHRLLASAAALGIVASALGCDPCAGTPSCNVTPMLSWGGQFIEHATGREVGGVAVSFARDSGALLSQDSIATVADARGHFRLEAQSYEDGPVWGTLRVDPPPPHEPYVVRNLRLETSRARGGGVYAGRLVVDPYMFVNIEVRDRWSFAIVPGTQVVLSRVSGPAMEPDTIAFVMDQNGRGYLQPAVHEVGPVEFDVTLTAPGYLRPYRMRHFISTQFVDRPAFDVHLLLLRPAMQYVGEVTRRGTREVVPGVTVEFRRKRGIRIDPDTIITQPNAAGLFGLAPVPRNDRVGEVIGDLIITPPAPYAVEVHRNIRLVSADGDTLKLLGHFGYGPQVYLKAQLVSRATGAAVEEGSRTRVTRRSGLTLLGLGALDDGTRTADSLGFVHFIAGTPDTGQVVFDVVVEAPSGFVADTLAGLAAPAVNSSAPFLLGPYRVGPWYPEHGSVRDALTDAPIATPTVLFQPQPAAGTAPVEMQALVGVDGTFRFPQVPQQAATLTGTLTVRFGGAYRDTSFTTTLTPTTSDAPVPRWTIRATPASP